MPTGTSAIHIAFSYDPPFSEGQRYHNQMSLSVADPDGPRGVYYLLRDYGITISANQATPGFRPGPLPAGRWTIDVDVYRLLPPNDVTYTIDVTLDDTPLEGEPVLYPRAERKARGPGWYRGDLHAHSVHSDARWDIPDLVAFAKSQKLDFVSLTDHNTVSGMAQMESLGTDDLLTMGGMELTTFYGHALTQGTRQWHEWRLDTPDRFTMPQLAQNAMDSGAFFIIAHPMSPGDPACSGCHWEYQDMRPGNAPAVEIWNREWGHYNEENLQLYYEWLNEGHRLVATGGTDLHRHPGEQTPRYGFNAVFANELTELAILAAVRRGHSYITAGPELLLTASTETGVEAMSGDSFGPMDAEIRVSWKAAPEGTMLRFIVDGAVREEHAVEAEGAQSWTLARDEAHWCTIELRDAENGMWAVSNPIFLDGRKGAGEVLA